MKNSNAAYQTVRVADGIVWIADLCVPGKLSVTNDAERVCEELHRHHPNHRIIYRDTDGNWDELVHEHGVFKRFAPARQMAPGNFQKGQPS